MTAINQALRLRPGFLSMGPASEEAIEAAEAGLNLRFSDEYRSYLAEFGLATVQGHEFTGISTSPRLDVVTVTAKEKEQNPNVPEEYYVIEKANIDGIIVWQTRSGEIYQTEYDSEPRKIFDSFRDYILHS